MKRKLVTRIISVAVASCMMAGMLTGCGSTGDSTGAGESTSEGGETASEEGTGADAAEDAAAAESADTGSADASGESVEVTFWTLNGRMDAIDPLTEEFNAAHDNIKVTVAYYDTDGIKDACKVAAQAGTLPHMWFNWGGSLGQYYVDNGCTYDLTAYAEENKWSDTFNAGALNLCTLGGQLSGYPTSYNVLGIYYRKDIFEQYDIAVPTTLDEFDAACATLKENGIIPVSTAGLYGWHVMRLLEQFVETYAGVELHDKMNSFEESWDNEAVVKAFTKYQEYCEKGYFPDGFLTADPNDTIMATGSGTAAMDVQGQWYDGNILQNELDINNFGWFPFPNGTGRMSAFAEMTQFNKNLSDAELAACVEYMDYLYSEEATAQYGQYYNLPLPRNDASMPEGQPNVPEMIENSGKGGTFTITDQAFPTEVADVLFAAQDAIYGGTMTPEQAAEDVQAAIEAYLAK